MKVSPQAARLAACVGTNLNNDGILLYEAMAVLFVAQVYGIQLTIGQQFLAALSCVIAGIGIAAVPDAGLISLSLVLATVGLPDRDRPAAPDRRLAPVAMSRLDERHQRHGRGRADRPLRTTGPGDESSDRSRVHAGHLETHGPGPPMAWPSAENDPDGI